MKYLLITALLVISLSSTAQVGVGTATPAASALLDVTSTTKGFLTPRMIASQRNAIASPVSGLIVYCADCGTNGGELECYNGTAWVNMIGGSTAAPIVIGDSFLGGKVAYILQPGDPGYISGQFHGLIAAPSDQPTYNSDQWGNNIVTGAIATVLGTGNANTNTIVATQGGVYPAAQSCYDLVLNGLSDWYLPSKDELNKLYLNSIAIGAFGYYYYWSSSEINCCYAWAQEFYSGLQSDSRKDGQRHVRAVRAF